MTTVTDHPSPGADALDGVPLAIVDADDSLRHELASLRPHDHVESERLASELSARMFGIPSAPTRIGRFDILGRLGSGGMGVVYRAYDPQLQRHVALKLLRDSSRVGRVEHERLLREAHALARIKHPNVVTVHEVGQLDDQQVFVVMELVEGQSLHAWVRAGEPGWRQVLEVYLQAGRGLAAAHAAGLVHRDFKPHNAIIGADGRVRVVDFGLVRDEGLADTDDVSSSRETTGITLRTSGSSLSLEAASLTRTDTLLGTPAYMSPEQCERRAVGPASDQWSFCVALYEALVRVRPFEGETPEELATSIRAGAVCQPPRGTRVPAWLLARLRRGMSLDPRARFGSMDELVAALARDPSRVRRRWLAGAGLTALTGALVVTLVERPSVAPCSGSREALAEVWGPQRRATVAEHLASLAAPAASEPILGAIDGYAASWQEMHEDACLAHLDGRQSGAMLDKRTVCLAERRAALEQAIEVLGTTTVGTLEPVTVAVHELPSVQRCGDLPALDAEVPLPEDPAARAAVAVVREQLSRATLLAEAGRFEDARTLAVRAEVRAEALEHPPLLARAWLARGRVEMEIDATDASLPAARLADAFYEALAAGEREVAAEALVRRLYVDAIRPGGSPPSEDDDRLVGALVRELPEPSLVRVLHLNNAGSLAAMRDDPDAARGHFDAALAALEAAPYPLPLQLADTRFNAAIVAADPEAQRAGLEASAEQYERLLGPSHRRTLLPRLLLARAEPDPRAALARYDVLCERYARFAPEDLAKCLDDRGVRHGELGELEAAADAFDDAASLLEQAIAPMPSPPPLPLEVRHALARGRALASRGRPHEALTALRPVLDRIAAEPPAPWLRGWIAELEVVRGEAQLALGRPSEAIGPLARATETLSALARKRVDASVERALVRARLALVRAHLETGPIVTVSAAAPLHALLDRVEPRLRAAGLTKQHHELEALRGRLPPR